MLDARGQSFEIMSKVHHLRETSNFLFPTSNIQAPASRTLTPL
jgi:hypothetical protein